MQKIEYRVEIPHLTGMTEEERAKRIEDYMRESQRQLRMIISQIEEAQKDGVEASQTLD